MQFSSRALPLLALVLFACVPPVPEGTVAPQSSRPAARVPTATESKSSPARRRAPRVTRGVRIAPEALASDVLSEANRVRRRAGAPRLRMDPRLNEAASRYARELAGRQEIEHVSRTPGLRTFRDRIRAAGAKARIAGENLARMTSSPSALPDRVVTAWMRSPGHRSNLLDPSFTRTGIGVWLGSDGVWYVVQLYATRD